MRLLRDVREATELLILLEITAHRHTRMKTIAEKLGMTVQGMSGYLKGMGEAGLVRRADRLYVATVKGVDTLHERFRELRDFVDRSSAEMRILDQVSALAGAPVQEGDRVGLFMEGGRLVAYPGRPASSHGRALREAGEGEDVAVVDLEGIVDLRPGRIVVVRLPGPGQGGTRTVNLEAARRLAKAHADARVGAADLVGVALCRKLDLRPDFEFGAVAAAIEAAQRGVDVLLLASEGTAPEAVAAIEAANEGREARIAYDVVDIRDEVGKRTGSKGISRGRGR